MYDKSSQKQQPTEETISAQGHFSVKISINQSNIRLLTRRITRLTQTQAGFTEELWVGKMNN